MSMALLTNTVQCAETITAEMSLFADAKVHVNIV